MLVCLLAACGASVPLAVPTTHSGQARNPTPATTTTAPAATTTTITVPATTTTTVPATTTTTSAPPLLIPLPGQTPLYEPTSFTFTQDGTGSVQDMTWSSWSPAGAVGSGTLLATSCVPDCAQGTTNSYPATVSLSGAEQRASGYVYTSMTIDAPTSPNGSQTYPVG